jgi:hypothetical protein
MNKTNCDPYFDDEGVSFSYLIKERRFEILSG